MNKKIIALLAVVLACTCASLTGFTASENDWDSLYYENQNPMARSSAPVVNDSENLLKGQRVETSQMVQLFMLSHDTTTMDGIVAFTDAVKNGERMADMIMPTDTYMAKSSNDTIFMMNEGSSLVPMMQMHQDNGNIYVLNSTMKKNLQADKITPSDGATATCVAVPSVGTGILFATENEEYIMFNMSQFENLVAPNQLYTIQELARIVGNNAGEYELPIMEYEADEESEIQE